ncbi:bicyclomycin resistance protein [Roseovarius sp. A-2]|uniref:multidrug effflux MFS transporter n=1 Tax=Roseovarius sp. A-2 TaxID=1570360 RepID=UPI0009B5077E|nr:multidrug effflux MFS transporter [Roseovarius sp. A-2]GAW33597.1 bicyclomycin resistance protein [Roseovarius sp. A-2]
MPGPIAPARPLKRPEFIALMAMMTATVAFSIDAMLPGLPHIAQALTPEAPNRAQLIITAFLLGLGLGTFVSGPLSDSFGRKGVILGGAAIYIVGAALAMVAPSLETLLAARAIQGLGAAAFRIVSIAIIRDLYAGRNMARLMSFVMMVFALTPAMAPLLGAGVISVAGWRGVFGAFILFATILSLWMMLRLPEPLPREARRPFRAAPLRAALHEVLAHPVTRTAIAVQMLCMITLFTSLSMVQPIFDEVFHRADSFPYWFFLMALIAGSGSFLNSRLVMRLGMERMVSAALTAQIALSLAAIVLWQIGLPPNEQFGVFVIWQTSVFFQAGLTLGNLNALAMAPMGAIAGMAASVTGAIATVGSVAIAVPIGLQFNGTPMPAHLGVLGAVLAGCVLMHRHKTRMTEIV